jgi:hypothetical protein
MDGAQFHAHEIKAGRDLAGRDIVHNYWFTFPIFGAAPETLGASDSQILNFLEFYLGTPHHAVPFAGRTADLARLDAWLRDGAPYRVLVAPAGRGKSALVSRWIASLTQRADAAAASPLIVFVPISIRYQTNLEGTALATLCARLAQHYGTDAPSERGVPELRKFVADRLRQPPPGGRPLLVVIDGLDEAANWEIGPDLFPPLPPKHLRLLITMRPIADQTQPSAWLARLNWSPAIADVDTDLGLIDARDYPAIVESGDPRFRAHVSDPAFIAQLVRLTGGDPLLIRTYLDALLPTLAQSGMVTPEVLARIEPGIDGVFEAMYRQHRETWPDQEDFRDRGVLALLKTCATALGPLMRSDLIALCPAELPDSDAIEAAVAPWGRLLTGDGLQQGYVFSHPRLADNRLKHLTAQEQAAWRARFLAYGRDTRDALAAGTLASADAPRYVVRYYAAHLAAATIAKAATTTATAAARAEAYALLHRAWFDAWIAVEGSAGGFLNDVSIAWNVAHARGTQDFDRIVHAALMRASVASSVAQVFGEALEICLQAGAVDVRRALGLARQHLEPSYRAAGLAVAASYVADRQEQLSIWREFLQTLAGTPNHHGERSFLLRDLGPRLPSVLAADALAIARDIEPQWRFAAWLGVVRMLPPDLIDEAVAQAIDDTPADGGATLALIALSRVVPEAYRSRVLDAAHARARQAREGAARAIAFAALAGAGSTSDEVSEEAAFAQAEQVELLHDLGRAVRDVVHQLPAIAPAHMTRILRAMSYLDDDERGEALIAFAPKLPDDETVDMVSRWIAMRGVGHGDLRLAVENALAAAFRSERRERELQKCWDEALTRPRSSARAGVMASIILATESDRAARLAKFAGELVATTYTTELTLREYGERLFPLDPELFRIVAAMIPATRTAGSLMVRGARGLRGAAQREVAEHALTVLSRIGDHAPRSWFLARAARFVPDDHRDEVIDAALQVGDRFDAADRISLVEHALPSLSPRTMGSALVLIDQIDDKARSTTLACRIAGALGAVTRAQVVHAWLHQKETIAGLPDDLTDFLLEPPAYEGLAGEIDDADVPALLDRLGHVPLGSIYKVFSRLGGRITSAHSLAHALDAIQRLPNEETRVVARVGLMEECAAARGMWDAVLPAVAASIAENDYEAYSYLPRLAAWAPAHRLKELIPLVPDGDSEIHRAEMLMAIARRLPAADAELFVRRARELLGIRPSMMVFPLAVIAQRVSGAQRAAFAAEAWRHAADSSFVADRVNAAIELSPALDAADRERLWRETLAFLDTQQRGSVNMLGMVGAPRLDGYTLLAQRGPAMFLARCLAVIGDDAYWGQSTDLLEAVGRRWHEIEPATPGWDPPSALNELLLDLSGRGRVAVLRGFAPFLPAVARLTDPPQMLRMTQSVRQTFEWWP